MNFKRRKEPFCFASFFLPLLQTFFILHVFWSPPDSHKQRVCTEIGQLNLLKMLDLRVIRQNNAGVNKTVNSCTNYPQILTQDTFRKYILREKNKSFSLHSQQHRISKMAQELPEFRVPDPKAPVVLIDEATLKTTYDAGPVCQCKERYEAVKNLKPFVPGGTQSYDNSIFPDGECLHVLWVRKSVEPRSLNFVKPVVFYEKEVSRKYCAKKRDLDELMFIKPPG